MANIQAPFGFTPYSGNGSAPTYEQVTALIANGDTNAAYAGDPVLAKATGYVGTGGAGTTQLAGIFVGCKYFSTTMQRTVWSPSWPGSGATGDIEAYIINDPNALFLVQVGGSTTPLGQADIFSNINFGGQAAGSTVTGRSAAFVDQTTLQTTATLPFRVQRLITNPPGSQGTDITTAYNFVVVSFQNVVTKQLTGI